MATKQNPSFKICPGIFLSGFYGSQTSWPELWLCICSLAAADSAAHSIYKLWPLLLRCSILSKHHQCVLISWTLSYLILQRYRSFLSNPWASSVSVCLQAQCSWQWAWLYNPPWDIRIICAVMFNLLLSCSLALVFVVHLRNEIQWCTHLFCIENCCHVLSIAVYKWGTIFWPILCIYKTWFNHGTCLRIGYIRQRKNMLLVCWEQRNGSAEKMKRFIFYYLWRKNSDGLAGVHACGKLVCVVCRGCWS